MVRVPRTAPKARRSSSRDAAPARAHRIADRLVACLDRPRLVLQRVTAARTQLVV
jgi:hypothetical protein